MGGRGLEFLWKYSMGHSGLKYRLRDSIADATSFGLLGFGVDASIN